MLIDFDDAPAGTILVAVSGGSDSLALLLLLKATLPNHKIYAATVDHGLRSEAKLEAKFVSGICAKLAVPHVTLTWSPNSKRSSQAARLARYELLVTHARTIGATTIALGHTLNDQAETLVMRSLRTKPTSGTRGMSGMTVWSSYEDIKLWRPALNTKREDLRKFLEDQRQDWINDPSNEKLTSERVSLRNYLNSKPADFPTIETIARFATLSAQSRYWLGKRTAHLINDHCSINAAGNMQFMYPKNCPGPIVIDTLSTLILAAGGLPFRPAISKLQAAADSAVHGTSSRHAVGRCLVSVKKHVITIEREARNIPTIPTTAHKPKLYDGVWLLEVGKEPVPFIASLERFRTEMDDDVYFAVQKLVSKRPFPRVCST